MKASFLVLALILSTQAYANTAPVTKTSSTAAANSNANCKNEETFHHISKAELQKAIDDKSAFIVDVNSKESYAEHHVPTAIHFGATPNFAKALPADKNAMIVAYCGGPSCTAWKKAATEACNLGYTHVRHFKDGISGWVKN